MARLDIRDERRKLRTSDFEFRISNLEEGHKDNFEMRIVNCRFQVLGDEFGIQDFEFGILELMGTLRRFHRMPVALEDLTKSGSFKLDL